MPPPNIGGPAIPPRTLLSWTLSKTLLSSLRSFWVAKLVFTRHSCPIVRVLRVGAPVRRRGGLRPADLRFGSWPARIRCPPGGGHNDARRTRGNFALMSGDSPRERDDWRTTFRPDIPSPARIYDYLLGGKDNYPADRQAGDEIATHLPNIREAFAWNRTFLRRAVRFLVSEAGIGQLIDIGTGLPAGGSVHEVAMHANPATRIVSVDNDPVVLAHGRALLHGVPNTAILEHDLRAPAEILADPELRRLIDFREPVAILLVAVLHFISDADDPAGIISELLA